MQINISEYRKYLVLAGEGNNLKRYVVTGDKIAGMFAQFERVPYIGEIECFECYTKNPDTGEGGWDIVFVEGVKEKIARHFPNFDCFITKGYPAGSNDVVEFYTCEQDDYELAEVQKDEQSS